MARKRVLIVDDEQLSRGIVQFHLKDRFDCDTASNAFEAYEKILKAAYEGVHYDILTLDEFMGGGMDGMAVLKIIRISEKYIPQLKDHRIRCVFISGIEAEVYIDRMNKAATTDDAVYLKKPFEVEELLNAIHEISY
jgi:CheY-like chemotaxis protein